MSLLTTYKPNSLTDWFNDVLDEGFFREPAELNEQYPSIEVREEKDHYKLTAELPGIKKDDIKLEVKDNTLTISGEKKHETYEKGKGYYYSERRYGGFERSFNLGKNLVADDIKASYTDGILEVILKKAKEEQPKKIEIK